MIAKLAANAATPLAVELNAENVAREGWAHRRVCFFSGNVRAHLEREVGVPERDMRYSRESRAAPGLSLPLLATASLGAARVQKSVLATNQMRQGKGCRDFAEMERRPRQERGRPAARCVVAHTSEDTARRPVTRRSTRAA